MQDNPYQTREQRLWHYYNARGAFSEPRPMSWHPGSDQTQIPAAQTLEGEPTLGHTIAGLEHLAVSASPDHSVQQSIENAFSIGYSYPIGTTTAMHEEPASNLNECSYSATTDTQFAYPSYSSYDTLGHTTQAPSYNAQPIESFQMPQWPQSTVDHLACQQSILEPAGTLPIQEATGNMQYINTKELPQIPVRESEELVGIGLYDNEDHNAMSALASPARESVGKDLKLEETWQPPKKNDMQEEGNDDSYSTDEAEENEEELPIIPSVVPVEDHTGFYPPYGDLSNQSFFFNDDDNYLGDDYLGFDHRQEESHLKPQLAATGNFMWF